MRFFGVLHWTDLINYRSCWLPGSKYLSLLINLWAATNSHSVYQIAVVALCFIFWEKATPFRATIALQLSFAQFADQRTIDTRQQADINDIIWRWFESTRFLINQELFKGDENRLFGAPTSPYLHSTIASDCSAGSPIFVITLDDSKWLYCQFGYTRTINTRQQADINDIVRRLVQFTKFLVHLE